MQLTQSLNRALARQADVNAFMVSRVFIRLCALCAACSIATAAAAAPPPSQGVSRDQIVIGTILDLSGPLAGYGKQLRMGMQLRVDEINEQGGLHGRQLRLLVEDSAYDPRKAVLAAQKLVNQDKVFAVVGHIGTAHNNAAMPVQFDKGVINFLPMTGARDMYEPVHRLKYAFLPAYYDQMRVMTPAVARDKGAKRVCAMTQDDEFGLEVLRGAEDGLKAAGISLAEKTTFKRGATDFSSQAARLKAAGCEMVVLGTVIRETVGIMAESRKTGFSPVFLAAVTAYSDLIPKLGGPVVNGLYVAMAAQHPYLDEASQPLRFWANKYKTRFGEDPTTLSVYGYTIVDLFGKASAKAGPQLDTDGFVKAMDHLTVPADIFGSPEMRWTATQRLGSNDSRLSQIVDGRWKVVGDYVKP